MIPVLTREEVRAFDAAAIRDWKVPNLVLMENAGSGAAKFILRHIATRGSEGPVVIAAGAGNNGADGLVVARHLASAGVSTVVVQRARLATEDAHAQREIVDALQLPRIDPEKDTDRAIRALASSSLLIDALYGTGLSRPLDELDAKLVDAINQADTDCFALDLPSGLDANSGVPLGTCVRACDTLTFGFLKQGLLTAQGAEHAGSVHVVSLGVPARLPNEPRAWSVEASDVRSHLSPRRATQHKYTGGHVLAIGGSPGKTGAIRMTAEAALRSGAGAVTIATWPDVLPAVSAGVREVMSVALEEDITSLLTGKRAVVLGPGLGLTPASATLLEKLLNAWEGALVLDADALSLAARSPALLANTRASCVLTPHAGEAARLLGCSSSDIEADRFAAARELAQRFQSLVVLKGAYSLVATPSGEVYVGPRGSSALATAGSGDVLGGIIGALACNLPPAPSAYVGVYLHARAGERWSQTFGDRGMLASEISAQLPSVIAETTGRQQPPCEHSRSAPTRTRDH